MSFNRPSVPPERIAAGRGRPRLWAEGTQQPRFDLRAFARVSLALSRRTAQPALKGTSSLVARSGQWMADNRLGARLGTALGRFGRVLPSRDGLAGGLSGLAALLSAAADVAVPPPPVIEEPAYPDLFRASEHAAAAMVHRPRRAIPRLPDPEPAAASAPEPTAAADANFDAPTLAAIRAMIAEMRDLPAVTPRRPEPILLPPPTGRALLTHAVPLSPPEPREPTLRETLASHAFHLAAAAIGWALCMVTLPVGAVKATLLHLNGEDLRTWS